VYVLMAFVSLNSLNSQTTMWNCLAPDVVGMLDGFFVNLYFITLTVLKNDN